MRDRASRLLIVAGDLIDHSRFGFGFVKATFGRLAYVDFGAGERHALPLSELQRVKR